MGGELVEVVGSSRRQVPYSSRTPSATEQRRDIQGLRAVAVVSVVLAHAGFGGVRGGFVGVDVFFVISGYLITAGLAREVARTGGVSILGFYARRARRILPAASLTLVVVVAASAALYRAGDLARVLADVRWAAFFAENLHLARVGTDYFTTTSFVSPVQHFWSLAVEEQFYLVWPLLIGLIMMASRARRSGTGRRRGRQVALAAVAVLSMLSLVWSVYATGHSAQTAYYSTLTRAWELGVGAVVALAGARIEQTLRALRTAASWAGLALVLAAITTYDAATPFPSYRATLPVLGSALVLAGGIAGSRRGAQVLLGAAPMRFLGDISYSLYLWHWPVLVLAPVWRDHPVSTRGRVVLVLVALVCAAVSYRYVEQPFRRRTGLARTRGRALVLWPVTVGLVLGVVIASNLVWVSQPQAQAERLARQQSVQSPGQLRRAVRQAARQARRGDDLPRLLLPALPDLLDDVSRPAEGCWASTSDAVQHRICPLGDTSADRTVVLFGDSHVAMWLKPLSEVADAAGYKLIVFDKASCLPVDVSVQYHSRPYTECGTYAAWALDQIKALSPDRIVVSGVTTSTLLDATGRPLAEPAADDAFEKGAAARLAVLRAITPDVRVLSDIQALPRDASACLGSRRATRATCAVGQNARVAARDARWRRAAAAAGATYVDLTPWFCDRDRCPVVVGNTVVYRDSNHVTTTYAERLKPVLRKQLGL